MPLPELSGTATVVFADSSPNRYFAADASGRLALFETKQGSALFSLEVPGVVVDAEREGGRVAVLSLALDGETYRPAVTIFTNGREHARMSIGPSVGMTPPRLDLCLIAGRPWVVVGSTRWMQLLDWESRRLLAAW
jgi:hypothetical protein